MVCWSRPKHSGSTDGFHVEAVTFLSFVPHGRARELALFWFVLALCARRSSFVSFYFRSIAGALAVPVRESEIRLEFLGISVNRLIHLKLVIAGTLAGVGGALAAIAIGHVDPSMAYWTTSGGFVFVTILAGAGSIAAAFVGSFLFELVRSIAIDIMPGTWQIILGSASADHPVPAQRAGLGVCARQRARPDRNVMSAILSVRGLEKTFGSVVAARDITLDVPREQAVGIIGANGAGKTTFVNMITGYIRPSKGSIQFEDRDITGLPPRTITRLGISRSFQVAQVFPSLTVFENMRAASAVAHARDSILASALTPLRRRRPRPGGGGHQSVPDRVLSRHARGDAAAGCTQAPRHRYGSCRRPARAAARRADQRHFD